MVYPHNMTIVAQGIFVLDEDDQNEGDVNM